MRKAIKYFVITVLIFVLRASFYMKNFHTPQTIIKTAIKENEITDKSYILCQEARTTGFDWVLIKNEGGEKISEYCNIVGASPFSDLNFRHEFSMAKNTFIFYVEEKRMTYSEATKQDEIEYVVTGWDIKYPVKHGDLFAFFRTNKYITEIDITGEPK